MHFQAKVKFIFVFEMIFNSNHILVSCVMLDFYHLTNLFDFLDWFVLLLDNFNCNLTFGYFMHAFNYCISAAALNWKLFTLNLFLERSPLILRWCFICFNILKVFEQIGCCMLSQIPCTFFGLHPRFIFVFCINLINFLNATTACSFNELFLPTVMCFFCFKMQS